MQVKEQARDEREETTQMHDCSGSGFGQILADVLPSQPCKSTSLREVVRRSITLAILYIS